MKILTNYNISDVKKDSYKIKTFTGASNSNNEKNDDRVKSSDLRAENCRVYFYPLNCAKIDEKGVNMDNDFISIRDAFCKELEPKQLKQYKADWDFYINSTDENRNKSEAATEEVYELYRDENLYNKLLELKEAGLQDKHLSKQLNDLTREFDEELNAGELKKALRDKENEIAMKFNSYVPKVDGKEISKAEINKLLQTEKDEDLREKAYEAKVHNGDLIADDMVEFVKMRNKFAQSKGYKNYFEYTLKEMYDVEPEQLQDLLDEVYTNAKDINKKLQTESKKELAEEFGIEPEDLKAYHYGLLLNNNPAKEINKSLKTKEQVVDIAKNAYKGMGYDVDNMPIILDLFPRKNKNTHGFCFDIQAGKDARILANLTNDTSSIDTLCHELGHCVYHLGIDTELPFMDQNTTPALTEAVAMMMGDLQQQENILGNIVPDETLTAFKNDYKKSEAKFINRCMQIIGFEKSMYENPDQNLPKLWHDLGVKYAGKNEEEELNNEWATIPHYLSHPGYYQNYFRADLMKAQMYNHLRDELGNITENDKTAEYLKNNLFKYGTSIDENEMIEQFTGEPLSSKALCNNLK